MYNNGTSSVKERENVEARAHASRMRGNLDYILAGGKTIDKFPIETEKKVYHTPTVELETDQKIIEMVYKSIFAGEDLMPSNTTMQFDKNGNPEIFEDVRSLNKGVSKENRDENKTRREYSISAKGKVLIAVYALVVTTIFSLIILNSRMLKKLDNSINNYSSQVSELSKEYTQVMEELDVAMSDETIIEKALQMGMEKA